MTQVKVYCFSLFILALSALNADVLEIIHRGVNKVEMTESAGQLIPFQKNCLALVQDRSGQVLLSISKVGQGYVLMASHSDFYKAEANNLKLVKNVLSLTSKELNFVTVDHRNLVNLKARWLNVLQLPKSIFLQESHNFQAVSMDIPDSRSERSKLVDFVKKGGILLSSYSAKKQKAFLKEKSINSLKDDFGFVFIKDFQKPSNLALVRERQSTNLFYGMKALNKMEKGTLTWTYAKRKAFLKRYSDYLEKYEPSERLSSLVKKQGISALFAKQKKQDSDIHQLFTEWTREKPLAMASE